MRYKTKSMSRKSSNLKHTRPVDSKLLIIIQVYVWLVQSTSKWTEFKGTRQPSWSWKMSLTSTNKYNNNRNGEHFTSMICLELQYKHKLSLETIPTVLPKVFRNGRKKYKGYDTLNLSWAKVENRGSKQELINTEQQWTEIPSCWICFYVKEQKIEFQDWYSIRIFLGC